jgi:hypothetical protein
MTQSATDPREEKMPPPLPFVEFPKILHPVMVILEPLIPPAARSLELAAIRESLIVRLE